MIIGRTAIELIQLLWLMVSFHSEFIFLCLDASWYLKKNQTLSQQQQKSVLYTCK